MIIPIKCFTCGNVLANKYRYFQEEVTKMKIEKGKSLPEIERSDIFQMTYMNKNNIQKTPEGIFLVDGKGNTSKVIKTDIMATNGVIHLIDSVLLP